MTYFDTNYVTFSDFRGGCVYIMLYYGIAIPLMIAKLFYVDVKNNIISLFHRSEGRADQREGKKMENDESGEKGVKAF